MRHGLLYHLLTDLADKLAVNKPSTPPTLPGSPALPLPTPRIYLHAHSMTYKHMPHLTVYVSSGIRT